MKRSYVKPAVYFENFQLSANIATGCGAIIKNPSSGTCGAPITGDTTVFIDKSICTIPVEDGSETANGMCYHVPTETNKLFNS